MVPRFFPAFLHVKLHLKLTLRLYRCERVSTLNQHPPRLDLRSGRPVAGVATDAAPPHLPAGSLRGAVCPPVRARCLIDGCIFPQAPVGRALVPGPASLLIVVSA